MLITTTNGLPGYRIEAVLGEVMGMTVRSANLGSNIAAGFRSLGGGELPELTKIVYESRNEVMNRMWNECLRRGGNAVVGMRFDTGDLGKSFTEVCAYGTAVVVTPIPDGEPGATPQSIARAAVENPGPGNWPQLNQGTPPPVAAPEFAEGQRPQAPAAEPTGEGWSEPDTFVEEAPTKEQPRRPAGPQEQRPNSGDSWLDLS